MGVDPGTLAIKAGMMALQMGLTMMNKIEGPRLDDLDVTTADYGTPIPRFWGKRRLEGVPIIWAEKLREKKTTSKTKGGKYAEYKYFGTFAVIIADHAIDSVSRIWMDKHLVYDATNEGPISVLGQIFTGLRGPVKLTRGRNMRFYLGDQTSPDPRMEAWCEDRYGPDSCPAYKDISYIVWEEIPLEKFGNRIPQITVEAINVATTEYPWTTETLSDEVAHFFSPRYERLLCDGSVWDCATRTRINNLPATSGNFAVGDYGIYNLTDWLGTGGGPYLTTYNIDGTGATTIACAGATDEILVAPGLLGDVWVLRPYAAVGNNIQIAFGSTTMFVNLGFAATAMESDSDGNVWLAGRPSGVAEIHLYCYEGPRSGESHSFSTSSTDVVQLFINSRDEFVLEQGGNIHKLDTDFTPLATSTITATGTFSHVMGSDSLWRVSSSAVEEFSLTSLTQIRQLTESLWVGAPDIGGGKYEAVSHAIVSVEGTQIIWRFLDRPGSNGVTFSSVASDVSDWCGVQDYSFSGFDPTVQGYSIVQGSGKDMLAPLMDIFGIDARPHDFEVQFLTRGSSAAGSINVSEFVREGDEPRYTITIAQDTDLPRQISVSYADQDKDQQINTVISQRPLDAVDATRTQQIDLGTFVGTPGDMQKYADRYFRRQWIGREKVTNALTSQYLAIEPGDVWNLQLDDVTQTHRCVKATLSQGRVALEWEREFPSLQTVGTGAGSPLDGRDDDVLFIPSPTKGFVVDIPLAEDSHASDLPLLYYGAGNYGAGNWPGATIFEGDADGDDYLPWKGVEPADKAVWGYATDDLGDASPWLWDRGNSVNITAKGTLTSCTEADINADPSLNLALLGDELLNFTTATLESDGSYTLSGFKRGRRGTEWATSTHAVGDEFVLVEDLARDALGLSDVGLDLSYKAQTIGRDVTLASAIDFEFTGASLKPYAPARLKWTTNGTDLLGEIIRRTRVGGSWDDDGVVPLSENSEEYEVDIYNGATFKRTITVSGTNTFTYTAAQFSADGLSLSSLPTSQVYQMSDAVGRGFALAA